MYLPAWVKRDVYAHNTDQMIEQYPLKWYFIPPDPSLDLVTDPIISMFANIEPSPNANIVDIGIPGSVYIGMQNRWGVLSCTKGIRYGALSDETILKAKQNGLIIVPYPNRIRRKIQQFMHQNICVFRDLYDSCYQCKPETMIKEVSLIVSLNYSNRIANLKQKEQLFIDQFSNTYKSITNHEWWEDK